MLDILLTVVPWLGPLLKKVSLPLLKWIAGGIVILLVVGGLFGSGYFLGHSLEESVFEAYKARSAAHELAIKERYDAIGDTVSKTYADAVSAELAETQRQLTELQNARKQPGRSDRSGRRGASATHVPGAAVRDTGGADSDRIFRVLQSAAGRR